MLVGHLAVGFVAKRIEPKVSLGTFVLAALLTLAWYNNIAGPPPPNPNAIGISSLIFFSLTIAWAYWMNWRRPFYSSSSGATPK